MQKTIDVDKVDDRKTYVKPEILHELLLETRAGISENLPQPISPDDN
jgi:hypothetical protein